MTGIIQTLTLYKAWADEIVYHSVLALPEGEATKKRQTNFGTMAHTLNHVFVVDDIFHHHLTGQPHSYTSRNTDKTPPLGELFEKQQKMNQWYIDLITKSSVAGLLEVVNFTFIGGGEGRMTREEIVLHVINHATYHRGFVNDMMYQVPTRPPANDFSVFLQDSA